jgi:predicted transposase YbfD/YdcC
MATTSAVAIKKHFGPLKDPRVRRRRRHRRLDIIVIAICSGITDCDNWQAMEIFAQKRAAWFQRFLSLRNGIPAHDTLERAFDRIDPRAFATCFCSWIQAVSGALGMPQIAIDGKTLRRSFDRSAALGPLHLVSAWATAQNLTPGQVAVAGKSHAITALPRLLEWLDVQGALVTLDALGCQKPIAQRIADGGGDYVLTVRANQERLREDIQATVQQALDEELPTKAVSSHTMSADGHGRHEERSYLVVSNLESIRDQALWPKLKVVGLCYSERTRNGQTSSEVRYFIGSRRMSAQRYGAALRNHGRIANRLHGPFDGTSGAECGRIQKRNGAPNLA